MSRKHQKQTFRALGEAKPATVFFKKRKKPASPTLGKDKITRFLRFPTLGKVKITRFLRFPTLGKVKITQKPCFGAPRRTENGENRVSGHPDE